MFLASNLVFSRAGSQLKDEHQGMVHYHLTDKTLTWAQVRQQITSAVSHLPLVDICINDSVSVSYMLTHTF